MNASQQSDDLIKLADVQTQLDDFDFDYNKIIQFNKNEIFDYNKFYEEFNLMSVKKKRGRKKKKQIIVVIYQLSLRTLALFSF